MMGAFYRGRPKNQGVGTVDNDSHDRNILNCSATLLCKRWCWAGRLDKLFEKAGRVQAGTESFVGQLRITSVFLALCTN